MSVVSVNILLGPAEHQFNSAGYARTYNYLRSLPHCVSVDAVVSNPQESFSFANASLCPIEAESKLQYRLRAYRLIRANLSDYDIYHYPNMNYPDWNPALLLGRNDVPVLLGPCEAGHAVPSEAFHTHLESLFGVDFPKQVVYAGYQGFQATKRVIQPIREALFSRTLNTADRIVAVNNATRRIYERYTDTRVEVIPYGVNLERVEYTERDDTMEILSVGTLIKRKGHEHIIRALASILSVVPNTHLHLVGTGARKKDLKKLASELDVSNAVTFHGYLSDDELRERFRRAQVFVHASHSEGYSHIRLEAMASGCPVVGTRVRGAEEMISDGVEGYLVEPGSAEALVEPTVDLLRAPSKAREMGKNARERIEQKHDWEDVAAAYSDIYRDMV